MRAILIDPIENSIEEFEHNGDINEIYEKIGNNCRTFEVPFVDENTESKDSYFCDEEALYKRVGGGVMPKKYRSDLPILGRVVVLGFDPASGESVDCTTPLEYFSENVCLLGTEEIFHIFTRLRA